MPYAGQICDWCVRTSRRETRVACAQIDGYTGRVCGAHRILELSAHCQVCGGAQYVRVKPTPGDVPAILADLSQLVADLIEADPSPVHLQLAAILSDATVAYVRMDVRTYPIEGHTS